MNNTDHDFRPEISKYFAQTYSCPGCVCGHSPESCEKYQPNDKLSPGSWYGPGCVNHVTGTSILGLCGLLIGFPKGFNRVPQGYQMFETVHGYKAIEYNFSEKFDNRYNNLNIPVWKHLDENGNTLVKGISPRINKVFVDVIRGDHMDKVNCLEFTKEMMEEID